MLFSLLCVSGLLILGQLGDKVGNLGLLFEFGLGLVLLVGAALVSLRLGGKKTRKIYPTTLTQRFWPLPGRINDYLAA